jgi:hypothetical protein
MNTSGKPTRYVMLRLDDGYQDAWTYALPILAHYGFRSMFAILVGATRDTVTCTGYAGSEYMSWAEVEWLYSHQNEISDHTYDEIDLGHQNLSTLQYYINNSRQAFINHGITNLPSLTLPLGAAFNNATVARYIYAANFTHFYSAYGPVGISNYTTLETVWYSIDSMPGDPGDSLSAFESIVNQSSSTFVVGLMFHHVNDHAANTGYYVNVTAFAQDMAYLYQNGYTVVLPEQLPGY